MCQYLPSTPIKFIKKGINHSKLWLYAYTYSNFTSVSKFYFYQNNRSETAGAVNLLGQVVPGMPKRVIGVQGGPGNQLTK